LKERQSVMWGIGLAPALIDTARARAREQGLEIGYVVGDCEAMPFEDASFAKVSSTGELLGEARR
jgi:ubiquinone/menaquinone biosynthesis C-methylase UbiE